MQHLITFIKGCIALALACTLVVLAYLHFNRADFSSRILAAVRSQVQTEVQVAHFDIDVLTHFPYVTAVMHDVSIGGLANTHLLDARELRMLLKPLRLLQGELEISKLLIDDGVIDIRVLDDRTLSMNIGNISPETSRGPGILLDFRKVHLQNVGVRFRDQEAGMDYALTLDDVTLRGSLGYHQIDVAIEGSIDVDRVRINELSFLENCKGKIDGDLHLDLSRQLYQFHELSLTFNRQRFDVAGSIRIDTAYAHYDLDITHPAAEITQLQKLLPPSFREVLEATGLKGPFGATGFVKGRMSDVENPHVYFDLNLPDGRLEPDRSHRIAVQARGKFDNGGMRRLSSSALDLYTITCTWKDHISSASVRITDFVDPTIQVIMQGAVPASLLTQYIEGLEVTSGVIHLDNFSSGRHWLNDLHYIDLRKVSGHCTIDQIAFSYRGEPGHIAQAGMTLEQGMALIDTLDMKWKNSSGIVDGRVLGLPEALEANDAGLLRYDLDITADVIDLDAILYDEPHTPKVRPVNVHVSPPLRLPSGDARIRSGSLRYNGLELAAIHAELQTHLHKVRYQGSFEGLEGTIETSGILFIDNGYTLETKTSCAGIDVNTCFRKFRDFGQSTVKSEHLRGSMDVLLVGNISWRADGNIDRDALNIKAGMSLKDGELVDFRMLDQFSTYVHTEDLRHIRFARIDNFIDIRNGKVYIPVMFIQSNAANLIINGVHTFDNDVLYNLKINAGQVLSNKLKSHNPGLAPIPAREEGTFNLYFTLNGKVDDISYSTDKRGVLSSFDQSEAIRESVRDEIKTHFGKTIDLVEPPEWENIPEYPGTEGPEEFLDEIEGGDF